ncbi:hypothetical protein HNR20_003174 [Micromonospora parathelypteridis]|uniref:Uncharacterized protein n=1 Tax=Micromonospora parathelypteridis TaxID=1839617 RepID=A0A840W324_9ACTN|nr:hypothetical protein [Micromonospora parathelypteridis]
MPASICCKILLAMLFTVTHPGFISHADQRRPDDTVYNDYYRSIWSAYDSGAGGVFATGPTDPAVIG